MPSPSYHPVHSRWKKPCSGPPPSSATPSNALCASLKPVASFIKHKPQLHGQPPLSYATIPAEVSMMINPRDATYMRPSAVNVATTLGVSLYQLQDFVRISIKHNIESSYAQYRSSFLNIHKREHCHYV